jgi:hypothetical protein
MKIYWKREKLREKVQRYAASNHITARRMKSIEVALCFSDLRPVSQGRAHFLTEEYKGCFAIDLEAKTNGNRLICIPRGDFKKEGDLYIEETIIELEIIEVIDYH